MCSRSLHELGKEGHLVFPRVVESMKRDPDERNLSGSSGVWRGPEAWRGPADLGQEVLKYYSAPNKG